MAGYKGYKAAGHLRRRSKEKRGGNDKSELVFDRRDVHNMAGYRDKYLEWLAVHNYAEGTISGKRFDIDIFLEWCLERDLIRPHEVTKPILESYQRHLYRYRKKDGKPLSQRSQRGRMSSLKDFFSWLCRQNYTLSNPASEIELPRPEKRLPEEPLSIGQVESILSVPDIDDPLGIRDRAMLELLYSNGLRRTELINLRIEDLNPERRTLQIRKGKGNKDRVVPVGKRALAWLERYIYDVRPLLENGLQDRTLFLSAYGEGINPDVLSRKIGKYVVDANIGRKGSCHLFRHTCATHMLENGADIRYIQQLLGHEKLETTQIYTEVSIKQLQLVHEQTHPAKLK